MKEFLPGTVSGGEKHYLEQELFDLLKYDHGTFEFLKSTTVDGMWYWDLENRDHEWFSPRFKALFGYEDHEVPNSPVWLKENLYPEDFKIFEKALAEHFLDTSKPFDEILRYYHKDGSIVWVRSRGIVIRNEDGVPTRMMGTHQDVTALKQAEAMAFAAHEASIDGLVLFEAVTDEDGKLEDFIYRRANRAALRILQKSEAELIGRGIRQVYPATDVSGTFSVLQKAYDTKEPQEAELHYKEGIYDEWFRITAVPFGENGLANSFASINNRKKREMELRKMNDALRRFAGVVSHDLQTPLRHIALFADLAEHALEEGRDPHEHIVSIKANTARMQSLIRSMLDYTMVAYSKVEAEEVQLNDVVQEALSLLQSHLDNSRLRFIVDDLPCVVGDRKLLARVFQNLVSNAVKHARSDNLVIRISARQEGNEVVVFVEDNGEAPDVDAIWRVLAGGPGSSDADRAKGGSGLGLSICKTVVEGHGGRIWVEPQHETGARFCFSLPIAKN